MLNVMITGADGFIGRALMDALSNHDLCKVNGVVRSFKENYKSNINAVGNIEDVSNWTLLLNGIDVVIHTAARAHVIDLKSLSNELDIFRKVNVSATINLIKGAAAANVKKFIFISSIGVNGQASNVSINETLCPNPTAAYAISKFEAEEQLKLFASKNSIDLIIIRPPLVYDYDAPGNFGKLLSIVEKGLPLPFMAIRNKKSFIYKENLVDFIKACVFYPNSIVETFVVSDGVCVSTAELISKLSLAMGSRTRLFYVPVCLLYFFSRLLGRKILYEQLAGDLFIDISKAKQILSWIPPVSFDDALFKTASMFKKTREVSDEEVI